MFLGVPWGPVNRVIQPALWIVVGDLASQGWDYWFYQSRTTADNGAKVLARVEGKH